MHSSSSSVEELFYDREELRARLRDCLGAVIAQLEMPLTMVASQAHLRPARVNGIFALQQCPTWQELTCICSALDTSLPDLMLFYIEYLGRTVTAQDRRMVTLLCGVVACPLTSFQSPIT